jgi:hypothetical protein
LSRTGEVDVDGVAYRWVIKYWEDPDAGSLSFSKRGIDNSHYFVEIHSDGRAPITFDFPERSYYSERWWRAEHRDDVSADDIVRAVRIAERKSLERLAGDDLDEALGWPPNVPEVVTAAITTLARRALESDELLVRCLIDLGFTTPRAKPEVRLVVMDWIASLAPELIAARPRLQALLEKKDDFQFARRSAFQILIEFCAAARVDLGLDTTAVDEALKALPAGAEKPWHLPWEHWWWKHGPHRRRDPYDD